MTPIAALSQPAATVPANGREQLSAAARQFEAIFVRQMLAAARKTDFGDSLFSSQGLDTFRQMQDERFADIASQTGVLGLAGMIETHLARLLPPAEGGTNDGI